MSFVKLPFTTVQINDALTNALSVGGTITPGVDKTKAAVAESLSPVKTLDTAGSLLLHEANGVDTDGVGFIGPDAVAGTVHYKLPATVPTDGQVLAVSGSAVPATIDGVASSVYTLTWVEDGDTDDHTALTNIGINTHTQIDAYMADASNAITDHAGLTNIGTNTHAQIDTYIATTPAVISDHTGLSNIGVKTHAEIDSHIASGEAAITQVQADVLTKIPIAEKGVAGGVATLNGSGFLPVSQTDPQQTPTHKVANIAARDLLTPGIGWRAHVDDASADPTVISGYAGYMWTGLQWDKQYEQEGLDLDMTVEWADVQTKPTVFPPDVHNHNDLYYSEAEIDALLGTKEDSHTHPYLPVGGTAVDSSKLGGELPAYYAAKTNIGVKQNLLTNSGFQVNSQSTPEVDSVLVEDDASADNTTDWSLNNITLGFDVDHYVVEGPSLGEIYRVITWNPGEIISISIDVKDGTASGVSCALRAYDGEQKTGESFVTTPAFVTHTFTTRSTFDLIPIAYAYFRLDVGSVGNIQFKNFKVEKRVPGYDLASIYAPDGWYGSGKCAMTFDDGVANFAVNDDGSLIRWPIDLSEPTMVKRFAGRTVTLGAWFKTTIADHLFWQLRAGTLTSNSSYHTGSGNWEWLTLTADVPLDATNFYIAVRTLLTSGNPEMKNPMLIFGDYLGEGNYAPIPQEYVPLDVNVVKLIDSETISAAAVIDPHLVSEGKLPSGAVAYDGFIEGACPSVGKSIMLTQSAASLLDTRARTQVAGVVARDTGKIRTDGGDVYVYRDDTFTSVTAGITGVYL